MTAKINLQSDRVRALDGLRAIAVLVVMVSHAGLGHLVPGGFGVTIFFFLSGYLITTLMRLEYEKLGGVSFAGFYLRRTVRIIPPMVICILLTLAMILTGLLDHALIPASLPLDFLFLTNYAPQIATSSQLPIPLWSLDVEEHFYLLFPALYVVTRTRSNRSTIAFILAILAGTLLLRLALFPRLEEPATIFYWTHTRIDSILYGCLLAVWNNPAADAKATIDGRLRWFVLGIALLVGALAVRNEFFRETVRYSVQGVGLFLVFNYVLRDNGPINRLLSITPLKFVGDWSYVLYLIHVPMLALAATQLAGMPVAMQHLAGFALAFVFAAAMRRLVEKPLHAWRTQYQKRLAVPGSALPKGVE